MTTDGILRLLGSLACLYTVGLFVSIMTTAALNVASANSSSMCSDRSCTAAIASSEHHLGPADPADAAPFQTAALLIASTF